MRSRTMFWLMVAFALLVGLVLFAISRPAQSADVDGRSRAKLALDASVVLTADKAGDKAFCSGTIVRPRVVLTAYHCVMGLVETSTRAFWVRTYAGQVQLASIAWYKVEYDVALVTVPVVLQGRIAQPVPDSAPGDEVWIVGAPDTWQFMVTWGRVGKITREAFKNENDKIVIGSAVDQQLLWLDARAWVGNSGGGVFNQDGQVEGILVRSYMADVAVVDKDGKPIGGTETPLWAYAVGADSWRGWLDNAGVK